MESYSKENETRKGQLEVIKNSIADIRKKNFSF